MEVTLFFSFVFMASVCFLGLVIIKISANDNSYISAFQTDNKKKKDKKKKKKKNQKQKQSA